MDTASIFINDTADEWIGGHGFLYNRPTHPRPDLQISLVAYDGTYKRINFDPETGDVTVTAMGNERDLY